MNENQFITACPKCHKDGVAEPLCHAPEKEGCFCKRGHEYKSVDEIKAAA